MNSCRILHQSLLATAKISEIWNERVYFKTCECLRNKVDLIIARAIKISTCPGLLGQRTFSCEISDGMS